MESGLFLSVGYFFLRLLLHFFGKDEDVCKGQGGLVREIGGEVGVGGGRWGMTGGHWNMCAAPHTGVHDRWSLSQGKCTFDPFL